jgi:hypothetical protein
MHPFALESATKPMVDDFVHAGSNGKVQLKARAASSFNDYASSATFDEIAATGADIAKWLISDRNAVAVPALSTVHRPNYPNSSHNESATLPWEPFWNAEHFSARSFLVSCFGSRDGSCETRLIALGNQDSGIWEN